MQEENAEALNLIPDVLDSKKEQREKEPEETLGSAQAEYIECRDDQVEDTLEDKAQEAQEGTESKNSELVTQDIPIEKEPESELGEAQAEYIESRDDQVEEIKPGTEIISSDEPSQEQSKHEEVTKGEPPIKESDDTPGTAQAEYIESRDDQSAVIEEIPKQVGTILY